MCTLITYWVSLLLTLILEIWGQALPVFNSMSSEMGTESTKLNKSSHAFQFVIKLFYSNI